MRGDRDDGCGCCVMILGILVAIIAVAVLKWALMYLGVWR